MALVSTRRTLNFREMSRKAAHLQPAGKVLAACLLVTVTCAPAGCHMPGLAPKADQSPATTRNTSRPAAPETTASPDPASPDPASPDLEAPPPRPDPEEIQALLYRAEDAMDGGRLLSPASGSALLLYDRVLNLDPDNETARRGIEQIAQHFIDEALDAAGRRRFEQATAMLNQARLVDPEHPAIAAAAEQITLLSTAKRQFVALDGDRLKARDPLLLETLRRAGMLARSPGCRAVVHARSDGEGRWIYQQMSAAGSREGAERIRANLQISWPPGVEILCFAENPSP